MSIVLKRFTFDMTLTAAVSVNALSREEAESQLRAILQNADTNFGAFKNGDPVLGEVTMDPNTLRLAMIDGEDFEPDEDEKWINCALDHGARFEPPAAGRKFWTAHDDNEETWRVDHTDRCTTKAEAARAYCESEGCEP